MEHSRYYKVFETKEEIQSPYEFARELSNGKFIGELNQEVGSSIGDEMTLEEIYKYIKENHKEIVENE